MSETKTSKVDLKSLLEDKSWLKIPKVGDVVKGVIISLSKNEIRIDIEGYKTGVVRGRELFAEAVEYADLAVGQDVEATVIDLENEMGEVELSFRYAGQQKAWEVLRKFMESGELIDAKIIEANKGGLLASVHHVNGFLPVSQLSPDNYPRVSGGDKIKILEKLKSFVGTTMKVKVIDVNEREEKLIVSEKSVWEEAQKGVLDKYKLGDVVEGAITAIADFGVFVKFDNLEGLVHISEIAWQRIDHPRDVLKIGQIASAEIIGIEGSKIFLSMKKLIRDPWQDISKRYKVGDTVEGTVLKVNPFGFFVELDPEIHGLAHVSELSEKPVADLATLGKPGDRLPFKIVSIEPIEHRLGLSIKALTAKEESAPEAATE